MLEDASIDMDRVLAGRPAKGMIMLGLRGVGKTVLLNRLRSTANEKGFRTARRHLIDKGMVWSQRHGETSFTVPMFDAFMKRQMPELLKHVPQPRGR